MPEKRCNIGEFRGAFWPTAEQLKPYFFNQPSDLFDGGNDSWGLHIFGLHGTEKLADIERINVALHIDIRSDLGTNFTYRLWDGRLGDAFYFHSKGDLTRRLEFIKTSHGSLLSAGLFIPFVAAWRAVKEFIETDGELPKAIEWISSTDLPSDTFPDLGDRKAIQKLKDENRIR